jgi:hypothetical protein
MKKKTKSKIDKGLESNTEMRARIQALGEKAKAEESAKAEKWDAVEWAAKQLEKPFDKMRFRFPETVGAVANIIGILAAYRKAKEGE